MRELTGEELDALAEKLAAPKSGWSEWPRSSDRIVIIDDDPAPTPAAATPAVPPAPATPPNPGGTAPSNGGDGGGSGSIVLPPGTEIRTTSRYKHVGLVGLGVVVIAALVVAVGALAAAKVTLWARGTHGPGGSLALAQSVASWLALAGVLAIVGGIILRLAELSDLHVSVPKQEAPKAAGAADAAFAIGDIGDAAEGAAKLVSAVTDAASKLASALTKTSAAAVAILAGTALLLSSGWLAANVTEPVCQAKTAVVSGRSTTSVSVVAVSQSCAPTAPPTTAATTTTTAAPTTTTAAETTTTVAAN